MGQNFDSNLYKSLTLNAVNFQYDICTMGIDVNRLLKYTTGTSGVNADLPKANINLLKCFKAFVLYKIDMGDLIGED